MFSPRFNNRVTCTTAVKVLIINNHNRMESDADQGFFYGGC